MIRLLIISLLGFISITCTIESELEEFPFDYNAFPDVVVAPSGDILCSFYNGWYHVSYNQLDGIGKNGGSIMLVVSKDSGRTWSSPTEIVNTPFDDRDPSLAFTPDGKLKCTFFQIAHTASYVRANTMVTTSLNEGKTWSKPSLVAYNLATSSPLIFNNDQFILPVYDVNEFNPSRCFILKSKNSIEWNGPFQLMTDEVISLSEPAIIEYQGRLLAVARADQLDMNMQAVESFDNGDTWTSNVDLGFPGQAPYLFNYFDSMLILAHRYPLTSIRYSTNKALKFSTPMVIDYDLGANGAYPSIVMIDKNLLLIAYYAESKGWEQSEIRFRYLQIKNGTIQISDLISTVRIDH